MRYSSIVVAAFIALASGVAAAPIDARTNSYRPPNKSVLSGNKNNGVVAFSGNGGDGGSNSASGVAFSDASSKNTKVKGGKIITSSSAGNEIYQYADGGDGSAVGTYGSGNEFHRRDLDERDFEERSQGGLIYVAPDVDVLSNNDDNGIVLASGNGGAGGTNLAFGQAKSSSKSNNKGVKGGKIITSSSAGNAIGQSADGGDGSAVGTYGSKNKFYVREVEERTNRPQPGSVKFLSDNDGNGIVVGSGNGGNGGKNIAIGKAGSEATSTNKWVKGGKIITSSSAGNEIGQSADGGDGSAVGSYGSGNKFYIRDVEERDFEERGYKYLSDNSGNGIVYGSGNGGDGGSNSAKAGAVSVADSKNKWVKGGKIVVISSAGNEIGQSADGGDGNAVGSYGSHNTFGH